MGRAVMAVVAQGAGADHSQTKLIEAGDLDKVFSTTAGEVCIPYTLPRFVLFENVDFRHPDNII
jgi:hypothetical protein